MRKFLTVSLCFLLCVSCLFSAFAEGAAPETGTLKIVNYNVDGLPIPAAFSNEKRDPLACSRQIPAKLNAYDADIIAVQEDFNFHTIHKKGIDMPYKTYHSGPIPFGDGLNFFTKFPMYNVTREAWKEAYGILDSSSDELTPKGFLCASMEIAQGVYIDVYDLHADADDGEHDVAARVAQFRQLLAFIDNYSADHAVIIVGDTNARFSHAFDELQPLFIDGAGFKDLWIETKNEGRYTLTEEDKARFNEEYHGAWWGYWDSAEKLFYRDGGGISFEAVSHDLVWIKNEEGIDLADHAALIGELRYSIDRSAVQDSRTYKKETLHPLRTLYLYTKYFFKSLFLILGDLPRVIGAKIKFGS